MKTIHKYELEIVDEQTISLPMLANWLHVGTQHEKLFVWAMIETEGPLEQRTIRVIGTGHHIPYAERLTYIGTAVGHLGPFVWHVFEKV